MWKIYGYSNSKFLSSIKISNVPHSIKCFFNEPGCDTGNIDGWTLMHGLAYFIIGIIVPDHYLFIVIVSIIFELAKPYFGDNARYIINPLVNLTGYAIGSAINKKLNERKEKYNVFV